MNKDLFGALAQTLQVVHAVLHSFNAQQGATLAAAPSVNTADVMKLILNILVRFSTALHDVRLETQLCAFRSV